MAAAGETGRRLLELRALTGLVLHAEQVGIGGSSERERLAELCGWFDDDVPLPELERAKQLLQGDGAPPRG